MVGLLIVDRDAHHTRAGGSRFESEDVMNVRNSIATLLLAMIASTTSTVAMARTDVDLYVNIGPPPVIVEPVPPPRVGYVWAPGYWTWNGHRHVWHRGYWQHERHGYAWVPHRWEQRGDRWYFNRGHWEHS
jgi:WXXGXW repeat (2 copies)